MATPDHIPNHDELHRRELGEVFSRILRVRVVFVPIAALFLTLMVLYERQRWTVALLAVVVAMQLAVFVFDLVRFRRGQRVFPHFGLEIAFMVVLQTGVIWLTGAVESPLLFIYVPLGLVAAITAGPGYQRWIVVLLITFFIWLMSLCCLLGWVPRTTPSFLYMGPGFHDRPVYVVAQMGILNAVVVVASHVGTLIHRAQRRIVDKSIHARQQALETLRERNRELVYLSGAIAHELKNPLASIQGLVQLLDRKREGEGGEDREARRIEVLRKEVDRMRETLDAFLNFSRPLGELTVVEVDPLSLYDELASLHEGVVRGRGLTLEGPEATPAPFRCDPRKVKQALINLLQNAIDATPEGGTISWVARRTDEHVVLGVTDTGPGMEPRILEHATDPGATTKPGGSGIGLAVARSIAEQHGGRLTARNREQGGCEVLLHLPLALPIAKPDEVDQT
jgi:signal transduction histidine kinase